MDEFFVSHLQADFEAKVALQKSGKSCTHELYGWFQILR
jgi:hypothetical protein